MPAHTYRLQAMLPSDSPCDALRATVVDDERGFNGISPITTCNASSIFLVRKSTSGYFESEVLGGFRMWGELPEGAARNWGKLAWSYKQGQVQVANILYERKYRGSVRPVIGAFFKYLSEPTEYRPSYHPITAANKGDLKKDSVNQIEHFVRSGEHHEANSACPSIGKAHFDAYADRAPICRFSSKEKSITNVSLHCQISMRPGANLNNEVLDFYDLKSNILLSNIFLTEIDERAPRAKPGAKFVQFFTFRGAIDGIKSEGVNAATAACIKAGLSDYLPGIEIVRLDFDIRTKPPGVWRPSIFSAQGNEAFCAYDHRDGFGRARQLGSGLRGAPEFILRADTATLMSEIEYIGKVEKPRRRVRADRICKLLRKIRPAS